MGVLTMTVHTSSEAFPQRSSLTNLTAQCFFSEELTVLHLIGQEIPRYSPQPQINSVIVVYNELFRC